MKRLKEEVDIKLNHILHDIKDLQKTIIHFRHKEKRAGEESISRWQLLGKEISRKWEGDISVSEIREQKDKDMLEEYDFSKGVQGKYAKRYAEGTNVIVIEPDVVKYFPDHDAVH